MKVHLSNTCYHIHHIEGSSHERKVNVDLIKLKLNPFIYNIYSEPVSIKNESDWINFKNKNPLFKINNPKEHEYKYTFKYPEIGLWAGNYLLLKEFLKTSYDHLIILEDDIVLYENFLSLFALYIEDVPNDCDCFFLFQPDTPVEGGYNILPDIYKTDKLNIWHSHHTWSTAGMLLTRQAAAKLIVHIEETGIRLPLDQLILETNGSIPDPNCNYRILKSYSLSRYSQRMSGLLESETQIQNGLLKNV